MSVNTGKLNAICFAKGAHHEAGARKAGANRRHAADRYQGPSESLLGGQPWECWSKQAHVRRGKRDVSRGKGYGWFLGMGAEARGLIVGRRGSFLPQHPLGKSRPQRHVSARSRSFGKGENTGRKFVDDVFAFHTVLEKTVERVQARCPRCKLIFAGRLPMNDETQFRMDGRTATVRGHRSCG